MSTSKDMGLWVVEYTEPYETDNGHRYRRNRSEQVLCRDLYRAIELFQASHPDGTPHVVRKVGVAGTMIVDEVDVA